jgi:replicative DNA helicase
VDYVQRIPPPPGDWDRRDTQISQIVRRLQILSVEISTAVIAGAQNGRSAIPSGYQETLNGKNYREAQHIIASARPQLHHLRVGRVEQEAPTVLGLLNYAADYTTELEGGSPAPLVSLVEVEL